MRNILDKHRKGFVQMIGVESIERQIQREIDLLDQRALKHEAEWGVGRCAELISQEMREKWMTQTKLLDEAIASGDFLRIREACEGTKRGYNAIEQDALARGYKPNDADYWEVTHPETKRIYRICKNNMDASQSGDKDVRVYTLEEVARLLELNQLVKAVDPIKQAFPGAEIKKIESTKPPVDWDNGGDALPF